MTELAKIAQTRNTEAKKAAAFDLTYRNKWLVFIYKDQEHVVASTG